MTNLSTLFKHILSFFIIIILVFAMSIMNSAVYGANSNNIAKVNNVKITVKANKAAIKWKKVKNAKGYQIKISTSKKFKKSETRTFNKKSSKLNIRLDDNKTYYIKVRAYKKINETKKYGKWSKKKSFTIKKKTDKATGYWCDDGGTHHSCNDNTIGWYKTAVEAENEALDYLDSRGSGHYLLEQCDFCGKWTAVIKIDVYK